jgi:PAS domain S-box-containing protein
LTIDTIPAFAWSARPDGAADFLNQHYLDYTGLSSAQAKGMGWTVAVHPDDLDGLTSTFRAILASGVAGQTEARLRRQDGEYRWFLFRANPLHDESGRVAKWIGINTDIEDRKRAETELRANERRYRELFNSVPVALFELDSSRRTEILDDVRRQGVADFEAYLDAHPELERRAIDASIIKEANQQALKLFGARDADALIGGSAARFFAMTPAALRRGTISRFLGEKLFQHEVKVQALDRVIDALLMVARAENSRNFLALTDITKLKAAEAEHERLRQLESDLAHVNRLSMMGELAASLAHEILHPIATVRNNARAGTRYLEMNPPNLEEAKVALDHVVRDADRAGDIVGRIRDHMKKAPPRRGPIDLNEVVGEVLIIVRSAIAKHKIVVKTDLIDGLAPVQGDRVQLQQVVMNLILNAIEAMGANERGARELSIKIERGEADGAMSVEVRDCGPGIDPVDIARVFEPFYTTKASGIGMGLAICRSIIDGHGGRLRVAANKPRGAVFQFSLPAVLEPS